MKKSIKFLLVTTWILFSRAYDAYSTYQYTPDLSQEANPLVSILGLTWTPLLVIIGLLLLYVIYAFYISTFRSFNFLPTEKGYSRSEFMIYTYLGVKANWTALFYKIPNSLERFNHYMGTLLSQGLVFAGIVSTLMWLLLNYTEFYPQFHRAEWIYLILFVGTSGIILRWKMKLFKTYNESSFPQTT